MRLYFGIFWDPDAAIQEIVRTKPIFLALLLLAMTHLAVVLGIPFGLPSFGIDSPYQEAAAGFEVAILSCIVTIGLVHLIAGIAHGIVRLNGARGSYLGLLSALAFIGCVGIVALPVVLLYEWVVRALSEVEAVVVILGGFAILAFLIWVTALSVRAVSRNYGVTPDVGVIAILVAGVVALPFAVVLYALSIFIPCPPFVGC